MGGRVALECAGMGKSLATDTADVRFLARVYADVRPQIARLRESLVADRAAPRTLAPVHGQSVTLQLASELEPLRTVRTLMWPDVRVDRSAVGSQCPGKLERFATQPASVWPGTGSMYGLHVGLEDGRMLV